MSELLENEEIEVVEYEDNGFAIHDDSMAEYAIKRIRETQAEVDKFKDYYAEQIRKMQERADGIRGFYEAHLERYFQEVPHKSTKTQESYELPSAKLVMKQQNPEYVRDEEKTIEFLKGANYGEYIKVKESLDWAEMKKNVDVLGGECFFKDTGEKIPGITVVPREPKFDVSIK